jgi:hypothetical protein
MRLRRNGGSVHGTMIFRLFAWPPREVLAPFIPADISIGFEDGLEAESRVNVRVENVRQLTALTRVARTRPKIHREDKDEPACKSTLDDRGGQ